MAPFDRGVEKRFRIHFERILDASARSGCLLGPVPWEVLIVDSLSMIRVLGAVLLSLDWAGTILGQLDLPIQASSRSRNRNRQ
jgi:hypothetical protein